MWCGLMLFSYRCCGALVSSRNDDANILNTTHFGGNPSDELWILTDKLSEVGIQNMSALEKSFWNANVADGF